MLVVVIVVVVVVGLFAVVVMVLPVVLGVAVELEVLLEDSVVGQFDSSLPSEQSLCPLHTQFTSMHLSLLKQRNSESVQVTATKTKKFNVGSVMMVGACLGESATLSLRDVGVALQDCSSLMSPQSLSPSQIHAREIQRSPLAQRNSASPQVSAANTHQCGFILCDV